MGVVLLTFVVGFFVIEAIGYAFHRLMHLPLSGPLYRAHLAHHHKFYPAEDFLSDTYRDPGSDSTLYRFIGLGVAVAALSVIFLPATIAVPVAIELAAIGLVNAYIHTSVHIRGHWLGVFGVFRYWRVMHYIHHVHPDKNFGIVTFFVDRVFGSRREPEPLPPSPNR